MLHEAQSSSLAQLEHPLANTKQELNKIQRLLHLLGPALLLY
jgi:hypothetical protein